MTVDSWTAGRWWSWGRVMQCCVRSGRIALSLVLAGVIFGGVVLSTQSGWDGWGKAISAAATFAQVVLTFRVNSQAIRSRRDFQVSIDDALSPLAKALWNMAGYPPESRRLEVSGFVVSALNCANMLTAAERSRTSLYLAHGDEFRPFKSAGRGDPATTVFAKTTEEGRAVWTAAEADSPTVCDDIRKDPPPGWDPKKDCSYRTFITVPILGGDGPAGLLTINAPKPIDLTRDDLGVMQVLAAMVGTAFRLPGGMPTWQTADLETEG